jgi:uncharacterized membrane protein YgdD (TMEM256/DUF423 family)
MQSASRRFCMLAALLLALATLTGALGAHVVKSEVLQTAVQYQFLQSLGLLGLGLLHERMPGPMLRWAGGLVLAGVLLFCGSLYLLVAGAPHVLGVLTPLGGLCLIAGWCLAALALIPGRAA